MLAAAYEGRTWYRPQSVSAVIYQDLTAVRCLPHDDQWCSYTRFVLEFCFAAHKCNILALRDGI